MRKDSNALRQEAIKNKSLFGVLFERLAELYFCLKVNIKYIEVNSFEKYYLFLKIKKFS